MHGSPTKNVKFQKGYHLRIKSPIKVVHWEWIGPPRWSTKNGQSHRCGPLKLSCPNDTVWSTKNEQSHRCGPLKLSFPNDTVWSTKYEQPQDGLPTKNDQSHRGVTLTIWEVPPRRHEQWLNEQSHNGLPTNNEQSHRGVTLTKWAVPRWFAH